MEAWVESDNVGASWARVIDFGNGPGDLNIFLAWSGNTGRMAWSVFGPSGGSDTIMTDAVFPENVGTTIAFAPSVSAMSHAAFDIATPIARSSRDTGAWCR